MPHQSLPEINSHHQSALRASVYLTSLWMWLLGWSVATLLFFEGQAGGWMFALHAATGPIAWLAMWLGERGHWRGVAIGLIVFIFGGSVLVGLSKGGYVVASLMNIAVLTIFSAWSLGWRGTVAVIALSQALLVWLVLQGSFTWHALFPVMYTSFFLGVVAVIARRAYDRHMRKIEASVAAIAEQQQGLRLLKAVVEQSPFSIALVDLDDTLVYVNPAFLQHAGYSEQEVIGQPSRQVSLTGLDAETSRAMREVIDARGVWRGVLRNARRDGEMRTESVTIAPVHSADNALDYMVEIKQDISERLYAQERISQLINFDNLTKLPNRFALVHRLDEMLQQTRRGAGAGAHPWHGLLLLDMDRFNKFNMARGSAWGDALLNAVAQKLVAVLGERAWVSRYTADQFAVVLSHIGYSREEARAAATAVATELQSALTSVKLHGESDSVSTSFGLGMTVFPFVEPGLQADASDHILRRATVALSHAKRQGMGQQQGYSVALAENARRNLEVEQELQVALEQGQLRLFVQPQCDIDGKVVGLEALVRWQHPERGLVSPGSFIAVAEESGQITQIGDWMLEQVCHLLNESSMREGGYGVAVNISANQFMSADFLPKLTALLERTQAPAHLLTLEVTESMLLADVDEAIGKILKLRELGLEFSLDDFGTGYSSLSYLQRLPIQEIKVDQSFIRELDPHGASGALVQAVLTVAQQMGLRVVAEGVEVTAHAKLLQTWDPGILCQGYLYSRPMSADTWLEALQPDAASPATGL